MGVVLLSSAKANEKGESTNKKAPAAVFTTATASPVTQQALLALCGEVEMWDCAFLNHCAASHSDLAARRRHAQAGTLTGKTLKTLFAIV